MNKKFNLLAVAACLLAPILSQAGNTAVDAKDKSAACELAFKILALEAPTQFGLNQTHCLATFKSQGQMDTYLKVAIEGQYGSSASKELRGQIFYAEYTISVDPTSHTAGSVSQITKAAKMTASQFEVSKSELIYGPGHPLED